MLEHVYDWNWAYGIYREFEENYQNAMDYVRISAGLRPSEVIEFIQRDQIQWRLFKRLVKLRKTRHLSAAIIKYIWMVWHETTTQTFSMDDENS